MEIYLLFKALHLVSVVAWFAGLFYLPRLFVYHVEKPSVAKVFEVMERKLSHYIMAPAAAGAVLFGGAMVVLQPYMLQEGWLHAKLGLVMLLVAYHISLEFHRITLMRGENTRSARFFRLYNEIPTVLLVVIVALVVFKPF